MKLFPFPFKSTEATIAASSSSWPCPSCATATPKTLSFRAANNLEEEEDDEIPNNPESAVMSGLRSERLIFDPGATSSMLQQQAESKTDDGGESESERAAAAGVAVVVMDSRNPFVDFRVSMAEVVEACGCGARDWGFLEELLEWYLRVNDESSHGHIVGAFADLLISAAAIDEETTSSLSLSLSSSSAATKYSFTSSSSTHQHILLH